MTIGLFSNEIQPTYTLAGCIDVYENAWPNYKETINLLEESVKESESDIVWEKANVINLGYEQTHRTNLQLKLSLHALRVGNQKLQKIHNQTYLTITNAVQPYMRKHDIDNLWHEHYNALKYSGGQYFNAHADGDTSTKRCVSAIIYLNDEYTGGEVEFVNFNLKIKPKPGMLLLFPSNYAYRHIAHPVETGTKYAIVTWLRDQG